MKTKRIAMMLAFVLLFTAVVGGATVPAQATDVPLTYIPGDVNDDGIVDMMDAMMMFKHTSGGDALPTVQHEKANYNKDEQIDTADTMAVFRVASGAAKRRPAFTPPPTMALEVFALINEERAKEGLEPLEYIYGAQELADIRADEVNTYFSHTRPNGEECFSVYDEFDMSMENVWSGGENIAWGHQSAAQVMTDWMNSEGHRENILREGFSGVIVGVEEDPQYPGYYGWVQYFFW